MIKRDVIVSISKETGMIQEDVKVVVQKTLNMIVKSLQDGETVEFRNFGVFYLQTRKSRIGRNPRKPQETVVIPERKVVKFKPGKVMNETITKRA
jgi:nucleoid DNA-binding protein